MLRSILFLLLLPLVVCSPCNSQQNKNQPYSEIQDAWAADYNAEPQGIHAVRANRNEKHYRERIDESRTNIGDRIVIIDRVPRPSLPVAWSDSVVVATVTNAQSFVTPQKTNVFTEYTAIVNVVLATAPGIELSDGMIITAEREGGSVKFPSGRIRRFRVLREGVLKPNCRYLLFLGRENEGQDFRVITGYEIKGKAVKAVDSEKQFQQYDGVSEEKLLSDTRTAIATGLGKEVR